MVYVHIVSVESVDQLTIIHINVRLQ